MRRLRSKQQQLLLSLLSIVVIAAFLWRYSDTDNGKQLIGAPKSGPRAEFFIENAVSSHFDDQGFLSQELSSDSLVQFSTIKIAQLSHPKLKLYQQQQQQPAWQLTAERGTIISNGERVELTKDVQLQSADNTHQLNTEALTIYPETKQLDSDQALTLHTPEGVTTAIGLAADLNQEHISLKQSVKGLYHATH